MPTRGRRTRASNTASSSGSTSSSSSLVHLSPSSVPTVPSAPSSRPIRARSESLGADPFVRRRSLMPSPLPSQPGCLQLRVSLCSEFSGVDLALARAVAFRGSPGLLGAEADFRLVSFVRYQTQRQFLGGDVYSLVWIRDGSAKVGMYRSAQSSVRERGRAARRRRCELFREIGGLERDGRHCIHFSEPFALFGPSTCATPPNARPLRRSSFEVEQHRLPSCHTLRFKVSLRAPCLAHSSRS